MKEGVSAKIGCIMERHVCVILHSTHAQRATMRPNLHLKRTARCGEIDESNNCQSISPNTLIYLIRRLPFVRKMCQISTKEREKSSAFTVHTQTALATDCKTVELAVGLCVSPSVPDAGNVFGPLCSHDSPKFARNLRSVQCPSNIKKQFCFLIRNRVISHSFEKQLTNQWSPWTSPPRPASREAVPVPANLTEIKFPPDEK